jgi:hypothetical protein
MGEVGRVVIGVDARVIGGELLHLIEAMFDRVEFGLIAEMPLAREISAVTVFLEKLGDRWGGFRQTILVARHNDNRERRADRNAPAQERCAARGTTRLTIPTCEHGPFLGDAIDVRGRMAKVRAAAVSAEIIPARVVSHQHDDVRSLLLRHSACRHQRRDRNHAKRERAREGSA